MDKLIEGGVLIAAQVGNVIVERDTGNATDQVAEDPVKQPERRSVDQGQ